MSDVEKELMKVLIEQLAKAGYKIIPPEPVVDIKPQSISNRLAEEAFPKHDGGRFTIHYIGKADWDSYMYLDPQNNSFDAVLELLRQCVREAVRAGCREVLDQVDKSWSEWWFDAEEGVAAWKVRVNNIKNSL